MRVKTSVQVYWPNVFNNAHVKKSVDWVVMTASRHFVNAKLMGQLKRSNVRMMRTKTILIVFLAVVVITHALVMITLLKKMIIILLNGIVITLVNMMVLVTPLHHVQKMVMITLM